MESSVGFIYKYHVMDSSIQYWYSLFILLIMGYASSAISTLEWFYVYFIVYDVHAFVGD